MAARAGRTALVTGGGRGIGRAVALDLARAGGAVAVAARTSAEVEAVAAEARGLGARAEAIVADVARAEAVAEMFRAARAALGPIDILVCGAGVAPSAPIRSTSVSDRGSARLSRFPRPGCQRFIPQQAVPILQDYHLVQTGLSFGSEGRLFAGHNRNGPVARLSQQSRPPSGSRDVSLVHDCRHLDGKPHLWYLRMLTGLAMHQQVQQHDIPKLFCRQA